MQTSAEIENEVLEEFKPFDGEYHKRMYDVRLPDGTIVYECYPNAGRMNATIQSGEEIAGESWGV